MASLMREALTCQGVREGETSIGVGDGKGIYLALSLLGGVGTGSLALCWWDRLGLCDGDRCFRLFRSLALLRLLNRGRFRRLCFCILALGLKNSDILPDCHDITLRHKDLRDDAGLGCIDGNIDLVRLDIGNVVVGLDRLADFLVQRGQGTLVDGLCHRRDFDNDSGIAVE